MSTDSVCHLKTPSRLVGQPEDVHRLAVAPEVHALRQASCISLCITAMGIGRVACR